MNIIFDLDDTLYLEKLYIYQGFWAVATLLQDRFQVKATTTYLQAIHFLKTGSVRVFDDLKEVCEAKIETRELVERYRGAPRRLELLPDVAGGLQALKKNNHTLLLLTNGDSDTQWKKVKAMGLDDRMDLILVADDFGREYWKPSAKLMDTIVKIYGPGKENYLVVGNGTDDLEFAQNAGLDFIYMKRPHRLKKIDEYQGASINNLTELNKLLLAGRETVRRNGQ